MDTKVIKAYIGANNKTGRVEISKIKKAFNKEIEGYTLYKAEGYWQGEKEKNAIVELLTEKPEEILKFKEITKNLKKELKQNAILLIELPVTAELI